MSERAESITSGSATHGIPADQPDALRLHRAAARPARLLPRGTIVVLRARRRADRPAADFGREVRRLETHERVLTRIETAEHTSHPECRGPTTLIFVRVLAAARSNHHDACADQLWSRTPHQPTLTECRPPNKSRNGLSLCTSTVVEPTNGAERGAYGSWRSHRRGEHVAVIYRRAESQISGLLGAAFLVAGTVLIIRRS